MDRQSLHHFVAAYTAGMLVARDPETGVETEDYHRFQITRELLARR